MEPTVRNAALPDADAVFALSAEMATSFRVRRADFDRTLAEVLAAPNAHLLVAEVDGQVTGYLLGFIQPTFYANGPVGWVEEIAVRADRRRGGVGTVLMSVFEHTARAHGCRLTALATRRAADFYTALGYEPTANYFRRSLT